MEKCTKICLIYPAEVLSCGACGLSVARKAVWDAMHYADVGVSSVMSLATVDL